MSEHPGFVVMSTTTADTGSVQVEVRWDDGSKTTITVPPRLATSTGIRQAIEAARDSRPAKPTAP